MAGDTSGMGVARSLGANHFRGRLAYAYGADVDLIVRLDDEVPTYLQRDDEDQIGQRAADLLAAAQA